MPSSEGRHTGIDVPTSINLRVPLTLVHALLASHAFDARAAIVVLLNTGAALQALVSSRQIERAIAACFLAVITDWAKDVEAARQSLAAIGAAIEDGLQQRRHIVSVTPAGWDRSSYAGLGPLGAAEPPSSP